MTRANLGAVRPFATAAVLALFVAPISAQVVERGRTLADLIASHPCDTGLENRIARVTDCDAADDLGDGEGAFQCWALCDGSAPWVAVSIGGGGGGAASALTSPVVIEGTTADAFEGNFTFADPTADWTWAWGADGTLTGATQFNLENLRLDGNTISTTDTNGNINLTPNGTGQVVIPVGDGGTKPGIVWAGDTDTGFRSQAANWVELLSGGAVKIYCNLNGCFLTSTLDANGSYVIGARGLVTKSTASSGAPLVLSTTESSGTWTNEGATATNYLTLPPAATNGGHTFTYCIQDSDGGRLYAGTGDTIRRGASVTSTAGYIASTTIGSCVTLRDLNTTEWFVISTNDVATDSWSFN